MYSHGHTSTDTLGDVMDQDNDHEDQCMARHPGFGCTCEQIQFEDRQREVAAAKLVETTTEHGSFHTSRKIPPGTADDAHRLSRLLDQLESQAVEGAKAIQVLGTIATKGAESLESLSLIIGQRIHFVELLDRAAAMIDPDRPEGTASYEARLDWLAKWREVVGR